MRLLACIFMGFLTLSGCEMLGLDEGSGTSSPAKKLEPKAPGSAGGSPISRLDRAIAAQADYVYNPIGKRDPYRSFLSLGERGSEDETPRTPLQRYEIDEYHLYY